MVSVLALNKLELKEMINAEIVENPVLEEIEESGVTLEEMDGDEIVVRIAATPERAADGPRLAGEVLTAVAPETRRVESSQAA